LYYQKKNSIMKITVTGSLGHISKPLTKHLLKSGHTVTVVSSKSEKTTEIEALGAKAAIGSIEDVDFLTRAFTGADCVYCMVPPTGFFDLSFDLFAHINKLGHIFAQAIQQSGVKKIIHLSSIGAHTDKGVGMLAFHYNMEQIINALPADIAITFMRPVGFYYNLFSFIPVIKGQGNIVSNYNSDYKEPWVSPIDIADAIAEEIEVQEAGKRKIRYVASDELSSDELATVLGEAIGKPDLKWIAIADEQLLGGLKAAGMNPQIAEGFIAMNASRRGGKLYEDYMKHKPVLGKVKLREFAKDFAAAYNAGAASAH
jgi:uncharacterized protein YbjT (DUF2867 family)